MPDFDAASQSLTRFFRNQNVVETAHLVNGCAALADQQQRSHSADWLPTRGSEPHRPLRILPVIDGFVYSSLRGVAAIIFTASHSFGESGASFLRSRHASGITARAAEGTPLGGVAKRSTARLRAVAGASTLLGWGHGRRQKDLRRPLAALRMSAALAADGVGMEARRAETCHSRPSNEATPSKRKRE